MGSTEIITSLFSILSILVSFYAVQQNNKNKFKIENLKINNELELKRYNDLKEFYIKIIEISKKTIKMENSLSGELNSRIINPFILEVRELEIEYSFYKFLLSNNSIQSIEQWLIAIRKINKDSNPKEYTEYVVDFSKAFPKIICEDLNNLIFKR